MADTKPKTGTKKPRTIGGVVMPTGQELYDRIMEQIEPELVSANLKKLDAAYTSEAEEKRKARYRRYSKAFAEYKKQYKAWISAFRKAVQAYKKALYKSVESITKHDEDTALGLLEEQILAA